MSFREKSAWITLVSVLVCFGAYFTELFSGFAGGYHHFGGGLRSVHLLLLSVLALVVLQVILPPGRRPRPDAGSPMSASGSSSCGHTAWATMC
jgi:hypothetical protein